MKRPGFFIMLLAGTALSCYAQQSKVKGVRISNQEWTATNLDVDRFRNGDTIPEAKTAEAWRKAYDEKTPAWCYYNNDPATGTNYGKLYNWFAVNDPRGLAPGGWHIPTDAEWKTLTDFLGGSDTAGFSMKTASGWDKNQDDESGNGDNESALGCLPGGSRGINGEFGGLREGGYWWTSTVHNVPNMTDASWSYGLINDDGGVYRKDSTPGTGLSIRCVRN